MIEAGTEWESEISNNLEEADIILLLVSSDFISSDYCWSKEMLRAVEKHNAGEARVIPILLRDCVWTGSPFSKIQALPKMQSQLQASFGTVKMKRLKMSQKALKRF